MEFSCKASIAAGVAVCSLMSLSPLANAQSDGSLDMRVNKFLEDHRHSWRDWNVAYEDGRILHDLIVKHGFKNILEIGTSTGHSTVWLAWAAAKTGGKVITVEIDKGRRDKALANFQKAGVAEHIDARLADAHELVKQLPGPFDFVFSDADKDWYTQYFMDLDAKVSVGGCFTAHNVLATWPGSAPIREFVAYIKSRSNYDTRIERGGGEGISISCKTTN